jgi:starvation-inducible DNA-binding protein
MDLIKGNETVIRTARALATLAAKAGDHGTADLVTKRIETHEKATWMLRSVLNP